MNRTIKDATVKRFYDETHDQLRSHLAGFVSAYNFAKRPKTLKGLTPYEFIRKAWTKEPERFTLNPLQQMPELNISVAAVLAGDRNEAPHAKVQRNNMARRGLDRMLTVRPAA